MIKLYHYCLALAANFFYGRPSNKLIVIGVTGTTGKSTTVYFISKILEKAGFKVGAASTIQFKIDKKEWLNDKKMTMIGRFALQRLIKKMVKANCQYAVIETTSQGIEQFRHLGINYDVLVFTNLYPEHVEAHGGFDNYKQAKLKLFEKLKSEDPKLIAGQKIKKIIIANLDDQYANDFINHWAEEKIGFTINKRTANVSHIISANEIKNNEGKLSFTINDQPFKLNILGQHNVSNALAAIAVGDSQGLSLDSLSKCLEQVDSVPGRIELINEGQPFTIIVDYAFEPKAVKALYDTVLKIPHQKIIHVLGSTGGGRDVARRPILGELAGEFADIVIVTNEDPYDENPQTIIAQVAAGARQKGKRLNSDLYKITDRREAINKALTMAKANDLVLITGKGSEQAMVAKNGKLLPWDDRKVVREELKKI